MGQESLFDETAFERQLDRAARKLKIGRIKAPIDEARAFYGWTAHKLDILELYLKQYRKVAGGGTYIDVFAGTGRIRIDGEVRPGSAAVAANAGAFKKLLFYEKPRNAAALGRWMTSSLAPRQTALCTIHPGNSNVTLLEDLDRELVPKDRPCFALLDPNSTELAWSTVVRLAAYKEPVSPPDLCRVELWILLNTHQVLMRMMPKRGEPNYEVLDRWFGDREAWWDLYQSHEPTWAFAQRYADRLQALGYGAAVPRLISDPKSNRPQYYMIHASDHPAAHSFMAWASRKAGGEGAETLTLPGVDAPRARRRRRL